MENNAFKYCVFFLFLFTTGCALQAREAYDRAVKEDTAPAYQMFLINYPKDELRKKAEDNLMDLAFYQQAQAMHTVAAYRKYLSTYPNGRRTKEALSQIEDLEFEFFKKVNTRWGYDYFLKKYPQTKFLGEIKTKKEFAV